MRTGTVRNLRDARQFACACERETGVVADPAWVLDGGGRMMVQSGVALGGYVLETGGIALTDGLIPATSVTLPRERVAIAAFWLHHGLSPRLRRKIIRQLVRDVRRTGKPNVVAVTPRQTPDDLLLHGLPTQLYAGPSGHPEVGWIQVRVGGPATLRRAGWIGLFRRMIGRASARPELPGTVAVASK